MSSHHQNNNINGARTEHAEARTIQAEVRIEQAEARTEQAKTRTEQAEVRTDQAETRNEQAKSRTEQAETRMELAEIRTEQAEIVATRLAAIVESSDDAIISKTLDGIITSWNRGAEKVFGYSAPEAIGKPMLMLIPPGRTNEEPEILARIRRGEKVDHFETIRVRKDGKLIDISATISPLKEGIDKIIGASKIARDITGRKRAEEKATWLASFPERNPNPIVELDLASGVVHYANPSTIRLFPDLQSEGMSHPLLAGLQETQKTLLDGETDTVRREIST